MFAPRQHLSIDLCTQLAEDIRAKSLRGESAYADVDGLEVHNIPSQACSGRAGTLGKTFSGYIDLSKRVMHFDCAESPEFHLTVSLDEIPLFAAAPGGSLHAEARESFMENGGGA